MELKKEKIVKMSLFRFTLLLLGIFVVTFYWGKQFGENRYKDKIKLELKTKFESKEAEIIHLRGQLKESKENNSIRGQKLKQEILCLEQQLETLKNLDHLFVTPTISKPIPQNLSSYNQQISKDTCDEAFRYDGQIGNYIVFTSGKIPTQLRRVLIANNHPFLEGKKLDDSGENPHFNIIFHPHDASRQERNLFHFEADNVNFQLEPLGYWSDKDTKSLPKNTAQELKTEKKTRFVNTNFDGDFIFDDFLPGTQYSERNLFIISKDHPKIKELLNKDKLVSDKKFLLRYKFADVFEEASMTFTFNQNNQELEIVEE